MSLLVKICGLRDAATVAAAVEAGANAIGFVFAASPREVSVEQAAAAAAGSRSPASVGAPVSGSASLSTVSSPPWSCGVGSKPAGPMNITVYVPGAGYVCEGMTAVLVCVAPKRRS